MANIFAENVLLTGLTKRQICFKMSMTGSNKKFGKKQGATPVTIIVGPKC